MKYLGLLFIFLGEGVVWGLAGEPEFNNLNYRYTGNNI